jgi:hypothetical protein
VHTISLSPEPELDAVSISLATRLGTCSLLLSPGLANQLADALAGLLQPPAVRACGARRLRPR